MSADPVLCAARVLLGSLGTRLGETLAGAPARLCLVPGGAAVAWDDCCAGQAWVRVVRIFSSTNFPNVDTSPMRCTGLVLAAEYEVGVIRCAATVNDRGEPPSIEELCRDVEHALDDARAVREAIMFDFAGEYPSGVVLGQWLPTEIEGGCVGGTMTVSVPL